MLNVGLIIGVSTQAFKAILKHICSAKACVDTKEYLNFAACWEYFQDNYACSIYRSDSNHNSCLIIKEFNNALAVDLKELACSQADLDTFKLKLRAHSDRESAAADAVQEALESFSQKLQLCDVRAFIMNYD